MSADSTPEPEPRPTTGPVRLEQGDLRCLAQACARDPLYDDRRLVLRRKLAALARRFVAGAGAGLETRTSLHRPASFNGMCVRRMWAYFCRGKREKQRLRAVLGRDLARDLDSAYRNAYLCLALESEAVEVSLRIHADAWYDGQNLLRRVQAEGARTLLGLLNGLDGFTLRLADWKGEWRCGDLAPERLDDYLRHWVPGELALSVERRYPAPESAPAARAALFVPDVPDLLLEQLGRLLPLYRYLAWSQESDFLFPSG